MNLKTKRKSAHLTQAKLAKRAGVSLITIGRYERGERVPPLDIAQKLAAALNCTLDELVKNT